MGPTPEASGRSPGSQEGSPPVARSASAAARRASGTRTARRGLSQVERGPVGFPPPTGGAGTTAPGGCPSHPGAGPGGVPTPTRGRPAVRGSAGRPRRRAGRARPHARRARTPRGHLGGGLNPALTSRSRYYESFTPLGPGRGRPGTAVPTPGSHHRPATPGASDGPHGRHRPTAAVRATGVEHGPSVRSRRRRPARPPRGRAGHRPVLIR
jgi:hypothetical protein